MLISAFAAIALFVAPEATQSGEAAKAAQPGMRRVCVTYEVSGSNLKRKTCRNEPVKAASLLSGEEGQTTIILHAERMSVARAVALLARNADIDTRRLGKIRQWRGGAVADVPSELVQKLMSASPLEGEVTVEIAQELPELFEQPTRERREGGYQGGGDRGGRGGDRGGRGGDRGGDRGPRDSGPAGLPDFLKD